ncbi:MAG: bactofilin family protein [Betaproteobacteria bacterium]
MFGWKKQPPIRTLVGEGTVVTGELRFADGLRIDGEVHGDVVASGEHSLLVLSERALVRGSVRAGHVIVSGRVVGPIVCDELLELQPGARVVGDVRYHVIELHPGATIEGELRPLKAEDKPALRLASSNVG